MKQRSQEKELLDLGPDYFTEQEYQDCLKKLFIINVLLGFFKHTVRLLKYETGERSILDVGCGGGLFLLHLSRYFPDMQLIGTDIAEHAIALANQTLDQWRYPVDNIHFTSQFSFLTAQPDSIDVILTTLVCHHLTDDLLVTFLQQMYQTARCRVIINDLHRHPIPYWFYRIFSSILFRNRLIAHDGLISIKRGFKRSEWKALLIKAQISHYQIKWCFPFRWSVVLWKT